jgi:hypothetical protein
MQCINACASATRKRRIVSTLERGFGELRELMLREELDRWRSQAIELRAACPIDAGATHAESKRLPLIGSVDSPKTREAVSHFET